MSGVLRYSRTASDALPRRRSKAVAVSTGSKIAGSSTVSKKRWRLKEATVTSGAVGLATAVGAGPPTTAGGVAGSGRIV